MPEVKFIKSIIEKSYRKGERGTRKHFYSITGHGVTREIMVVPNPRALNDKTNEASRASTKTWAIHIFEAQVAWELKRIADGLPTGHEDIPCKL